VISRAALPARRSRQEDRIMVRSTAVRNAAVRHSLRRAAALAATGTLAVLATAAPALASSAPAPVAGVAAVSSVSGAARDAQAQAQPQQLAVSVPQANAPAVTPQDPPPCVHHHRGLLSSLLEATGTLLSELLGALL
jgi:hypothetical protein